jgi:hypothetical protein
MNIVYITRRGDVCTCDETLIKMSIVLRTKAIQERTKINKCSDCDTWYCGPSKLVDKLEWQEEQVYPDGTKNRSDVSSNTAEDYV